MKIEDVDFEELIKKLNPIDGKYEFENLTLFLKDYEINYADSHFNLLKVTGILSELGYKCVL